MNGSDGLRWRKSTFSGANGGGCVEVADHDGMILVRDTKDHGRGPVHRYTGTPQRSASGRRLRFLVAIVLVRRDVASRRRVMNHTTCVSDASGSRVYRIFPRSACPATSRAQTCVQIGFLRCSAKRLAASDVQLSSKKSSSTHLIM